MNDFFSDFKFVLPDLDDVREFLGKCLDKFAQWFDFDRIESVLRYDSNNPLLFNTGLFLLLFTAFLLLYRLLRFSPTLKKIFVILFSLYFYYKSSAECCFILLGVCVSDYVLGLILGNSHRKSVRTGIVALNVVINVRHPTPLCCSSMAIPTPMCLLARACRCSQPSSCLARRQLWWL